MIHTAFDAAFYLFGKAWPALGAVGIAAGIYLTIRAFASLWFACVGRFED